MIQIPEFNYYVAREKHFMADYKTAEEWAQYYNGLLKEFEGTHKFVMALRTANLTREQAKMLVPYVLCFGGFAKHMLRLMSGQDFKSEPYYTLWRQLKEIREVMPEIQKKVDDVFGEALLELREYAIQ